MASSLVPSLKRKSGPDTILPEPNICWLLGPAEVVRKSVVADAVWLTPGLRDGAHGRGNALPWEICAVNDYVSMYQKCDIMFPYTLSQIHQKGVRCFHA
jgi:hypothetical protein